MDNELETGTVTDTPVEAPITPVETTEATETVVTPESEETSSGSETEAPAEVPVTETEAA